jgi:hypothetical protein
MIRVIQMLFAEIFKKYYPSLSIDEIIDKFREDKQGRYSLSNICKKGRISTTLIYSRKQVDQLSLNFVHHERNTFRRENRKVNEIDF